MEVIKYKLRGADAVIPYSEEHLALVLAEADNGAYTIEDDGTTAPETEQTTEEQLAELADAIERGLTT